MYFPEEILGKYQQYKGEELYDPDREFVRKPYEASAYNGFLIPFVEISSLNTFPIMRVFHLFDISVLLEYLINDVVGNKSQYTPYDYKAIQENIKPHLVLIFTC
jgi:hypothetical protein